MPTPGAMHLKKYVTNELLVLVETLNRSMNITFNLLYKTLQRCIGKVSWADRWINYLPKWSIVRLFLNSYWTSSLSWTLYLLYSWIKVQFFPFIFFLIAINKIKAMSFQGMIHVTLSWLRHYCSTMFLVSKACFF